MSNLNRDNSIRLPVYIWLLVGLFPVLPDYFGIGRFSVFYFIPFMAILCIVIRKVNLKIKKAFLRKNGIFFALNTIPFVVHFQIGTSITWMLTTIAVLYVIDVSIYRHEQIEKVIDVILNVSIVINLIALIEKITNFNIWSLFETATNISNDASAYFRYGQIRIEASFGVALTFSLYLTFINALALYKMTTSNGYKANKFRINHRSAIYGISYVLSFVCLIFTQCRLPFLTLIFIQVCFLLRGNVSTKIKGLVVTFFALILAFVLWGNTLAEKFGGYISLIADVLNSSKGGTAEDMTTAYRIELFGVLIPYIKERLLFGYGASYMVDKFSFVVLNHQHTSIDNNYLAQAMYYGIIGLLGNVYYLIISIAFGIRQWFLRKKLDAFEFSFILLVVVYAINLFSVYQMLESRIFYVLVGLYCKYRALKKEEMRVTRENI